MTGRSYKVDGERFPSVTTILQMLDKPGLATWRGHVGNQRADEISREATDHGTAIHQLIERINRGDRGPFGEPGDTIVAPYIAWYDANVRCVLGAEKLIVSRRFRYAGTADIVAMLLHDRHAAVLDVKTSKTDLARREWELQLGAYALGLEEEGTPTERRIILRMPRAEPGTLHVLELPADELVLDQQAFVHVLKVWRWHADKTPIRKPLGPRILFNRGVQK